TTGTIHGVVTFEGTPPPRKPMEIGGVSGCPHQDPAPLTEDVVVSDGRLANALVYLREGHEGWIAPAPAAAPIDLDQKGCLYRPHVLAMRVGQKLLVHNSDPTSHNVNIRTERNEAKNPIQAVGSAPIEW